MQSFFYNKNNRLLLVLISSLLIFNIYNIISNTPMVPDQHWAQKIFYVHVPSAWVGFLSYLIVMIAGIMFFLKKNDYSFVSQNLLEFASAFVAKKLKENSNNVKTNF